MPGGGLRLHLNVAAATRRCGRLSVRRKKTGMA